MLDEIIELRRLREEIVSDRGQLAILCCAEPDALLGAWTVASIREHHAAVDTDLYRSIQGARCRRCDRRLRPREKLASEAGTNEPRNDAHIFAWNTQHLRHHDSMIHDSLRALVQRVVLAVPHGHRTVQFHGIMSLDRRDIGLVERHWR